MTHDYYEITEIVKERAKISQRRKEKDYSSSVIDFKIRANWELYPIMSEKFDHDYRPRGREFVAGREQVTQ